LGVYKGQKAEEALGPRKGLKRKSFWRSQKIAAESPAGRNSGIPELLLAHASWVFLPAFRR
jgi:hypothetical protein